MKKRRAHYLKPNHHTSVITRMIWVDTEAVNEAGVAGPGWQTLTFGWAIYERYRDSWAESPVESDRIRFTTAHEFWAWVDSKTDSQSVTWIFCHNWNYDAGILDTSNILPELGWNLGKYINGKPPLIVSWKRDGRSLKMVDTLNYFGSSLARLGKSIGLPKLAMPEDDAPAEEWDAYAIRDVEIIQSAILTWRRFVVDQDLGAFQATLASQAFSAYRHRFMPISILVHDHAAALALEREAYHGGRTEAFWHGRIDGPLYKLDINSMYPAIMAREPVGYHLEAYFPEWAPQSWDRAILDGKHLVARVTLDTDEPVYGVVHGQRLIFPVGRFDTTLSTPEIRYAQAHGHIVSIGAFAVYRKGVLFQAYVEHFYALRKRYEADGNHAFGLMCKIIMNSLYGKFGQRGNRWEGTDLEWPDTAKVGVMPWVQPDPDVAPVQLRQRLGRTQVETAGGEAENSVPIISTEICAYGRVWLWELVQLAGEDHVYYIDTDSLLVDQVGYDALAHLIDPDALGALKLEGVFDAAEINAPKDYALDGARPERKIKGVRSTAEVLGDNVFLQETFRSWDWNLSREEDGGIDVVSTVKTLSRINTKRRSLGVNQRNAPWSIDPEREASDLDIADRELGEAEYELLELAAHLGLLDGTGRARLAPTFGSRERADYDADNRGRIPYRVRIANREQRYRGRYNDAKARQAVAKRRVAELKKGGLY